MSRAENKLRVLLITSRADYGGGPEYVYRLITSLSGKVDFFCACPDDVPYRKKYSDIVGSERILIIPHRKFDLNSFIKLIKFAKQNKINLLHSHGKGAGVYSRPAALVSGIKCLHTFHGLHTGEYGRTGKLFYLLLEKILSKLSRGLIAVSDSEKKALMQNGISPESKITVINNGVITGTQQFASPDLTGRLNVISVTRFDYAKNPGLTLDIIDHLIKKEKAKRFNFIFVGDGGERKHTETKAAEIGLSEYVTFTGFTDDVSSYYLNAFCYLSTSRWEGMPLSVLEAMSYGVPVIATDVTGNRDVVLHGRTGYLFNPDDPEAAAELLLRLADDPEAWKNFSEAAASHCRQNFSFDKTAEANLNLYNNILDY